MNTVSSNADYEKRKALHANNLSGKGVKFFPKDFEKASVYGNNASINTSVKYKLSSDEGFGRAEYIKSWGNLWQHQESNVSVEIGYALPDKLNMKMIEETIDKMMAERKKLQEKLNKKWTNSESHKANEFSEKLAKIIEKEEEFKEHLIDVNAEIKTIEIALQHKNQKINALQNPKNFKQKASITWKNFKSFVIRKSSELDQHLTEKVKFENELKTTQDALELVKNKQKELELERNTIINDFLNSL